MASGNKFLSNTLLQTLLTLKDNILKGLHVAEICQILEVKKNKYFVSLLTNKDIKFYCHSITDNSFKVNDIVVVVFTDNDFRTNLNNINKGQPIYKVDSEVKHSMDYGIIVGSVGDNSGTINEFLVDGDSVVQNAIGRLFTKNGNYNAVTNKLATERDLCNITSTEIEITETD